MALDDSKRTPVAGILRPQAAEPEVRSIPNEPDHLRRLCELLKQEGLAVACYEAATLGLRPLPATLWAQRLRRSHISPVRQSPSPVRAGLGLPLGERQRDEPPTVRFGSSPEDGLPKLETDLGGVPTGVRQLPGWRMLLRPRRCGVTDGALCAWGIESTALRWPHSPPPRARSALYRQPLDYPASAARSRPREASRRSSGRFPSHASAVWCAHRPALTTSTPSLAISSPLETGHFQPGASNSWPSASPAR
jgi:hypothetical protein